MAKDPDINKKLFDYVAGLGIIEAKKLEAAYRRSQKENNSLRTVLLIEDLISTDSLSQIMADLYGTTWARLQQVIPETETVAVIPPLVAAKQKIVAFKNDELGLHVAMANPEDKEMVDFISKKTGLPVIAHYASSEEIAQALGWYNNTNQETLGDLTKGEADKKIEVVKLVDTIFGYAKDNRASDIHLEPEKERANIRFRIDGILHDLLSIEMPLYLQVVTRLKVLAKLRTDEHLEAQDGKINYEKDGTDFDVRISIVPLIHGEKVVMRLLTNDNRQITLQNLGFSPKDLVKVEKGYSSTHGMILATGPTGSGKTTTMYAILKILNRKEVNIMTIEDPVEYEIAGINQIQINTTGGLTFASGLRSIVRQDPDIVLVGEVRDSETANISVNSAMTGHLVLSTLHTNDAATTLPRLNEMGVEPFLIASTVNLIIGQRLVRKICPNCRVSIEKSWSELEKEIGKEKIVWFKKLMAGQQKSNTGRVYQGKGCPSCRGSGYLGRLGIFEVLLVTPAIREAIMARKDADKIKQIAISEGMSTMIDDGLVKISSGLTTIEEVMRVIKE